jgi:filamentous hemagglutinin family protein
MTIHNPKVRVFTISFLTSFIGCAMPSVAQSVIPDNTLGSENSIVTPNVPLGNGEATNRIDGGAMRGTNIFHSFQEFNVNNRENVHFANPTGIENIIGRVTGLNSSAILGTLGVLGNANLFLLNPNGFIFGPNASLNINGSFVASTSESLLLGNGVEFSATNPQPVTLLTVSVTPGLGDWLNPRNNIIGNGNLKVGNDLTLIGNNLNLGGQLEAGGNLTLKAIENVQIGDAISFNDSMIRAGGNVNLSIYTGASLQILAGGSVTIDTVNITSTEAENPIRDIVTLSDGITTFVMDGSKTTLDIRAGTTNIIDSDINKNNKELSSISNLNKIGTRADIQINQITNPRGLVFLSNQDQSNSSLSGNIQVGVMDLSSETNGGSVILDSRGKINVDQIIEVSGIGGDGGDVLLLANDQISLPVSAQILSYGFGGVGGNITLTSKSVIKASYLESITFGEGIGGDIKLTAPQIFLGDISLTEPPESSVGSIASVLLGKGQGGNIKMEADYLEINGDAVAVVTAEQSMGDSGNIFIDADNISLKNNSFIFAVAVSSIGGNTGDINIQTNDLTLTEGSQINSQVLGVGSSGQVNINAKNSINLLGTLGFFPSAIITEVFPDAIGNGGMISIKTASLNLSDGGQVRASTNGNGNGGSIFVEAKNVTIDGGTFPDINPESTVISSAIVSEVQPTAIGNGNTIDITTEKLTVTNGGFISAATDGIGNAGNINLKVSKSANFSGSFTNKNLEEPQPSGAFVGVLEGAVGEGGTLKITTPELRVTNGAQLEALTESSGNAGNIEIFGTNKVLFSGVDTGLFSNTTETSTGDAGNIFVESELIKIQNGALISVDSQGKGVGGSVTVKGDNLTLNNQGKISATTASSNGGNITLALNDLILLRYNSKVTTDAGTAEAGGNGGNITITSPFIIAPSFENSDITANAFEGDGGDIDITANGLFGIEFRLEQTPRSDITASSEFGLAGTVAINNPDVDPTSGLVELPDQTTDPSDRVIAGCAAAAGNSFTITGRGGLPENPTSTIRGETVVSDLRDLTESDSQENLPPVKNQVHQQPPKSIVQVNGWILNQNGEVQLIAASPKDTSLLQGQGGQFVNVNPISTPISCPN